MFQSIAKNSVKRISPSIVANRFYSAAAASHSKRLHGKVCVVTGAGSGIGKGIALQYAKEGGKVVVADLRLEAAQQTVDEIKGLNKEFVAEAIALDVTSEQQVDSKIDAIAEKLGSVDVIVCNAGIQHIDPVDKLSFENWRKVLSVHLDASFLCTRAALRHMYKQNGGSIIYIGSVHSKLASVLKAPYVSAKHGVLGLCRTVAKEGAAHGVRANVVCPGFVLTPLVQKQIPEQAANLGITEEEVVKKVMLKDTVNGEFVSVEDVAEVCTELAGFKSNALTGQSIIVSNGWCME